MATSLKDKTADPVSISICVHHHLHIAFNCCKCKNSIHLEGIPNDSHYARWFFAKSIAHTESGLVCNNCRENRKE